LRTYIIFYDKKGDFALLVRAGMTPFQALFYNYLSGNAAFVGCVIGIYYGDNIQSARWIFSISAGTTLFLSLGVLVSKIMCF
jgi:zinc transporter ZupT